MTMPDGTECKIIHKSLRGGERIVVLCSTTDILLQVLFVSDIMFTFQ